MMTIMIYKNIAKKGVNLFVLLFFVMITRNVHYSITVLVYFIYYKAITRYSF